MPTQIRSFESVVARKGTRNAKCYRPRGSDAELLLNVIGLERMFAVQDALGGRRIFIPKRNRFVLCGLCGMRNRCIRQWNKKGASVKAIAAAIKLAPVTVTRVLRGR